jgi:hypothetical protein
MVMAKIKVSQATIDKIKAMGMTKALKGAADGKANAEMREGLKRMYGARRLNAAETSTKPYNVRPSKPAAKSPDQARGAMSAPSKSVYKSADAARAAMPGKGPMVKVTASTKKSTTTDPLAKAVFSAGRAISNNGAGTSTRKAVAGKPSVGEKISAAFTGKGVGNRTTAQSVAATNAKRMGISVAEYNKRLAAKKR